MASDERVPVLVDEVPTARRQRRRPKPKKADNALSATAPTFTPRQVTTASVTPRLSQGDHTVRGKPGRKGVAGRAAGRGRMHHSLPQAGQDCMTPTETTSVQSTKSLRRTSLVHDVQEAETIMERLQQALARNAYECCICCDIIKRHQPVYEDHNCWAVFHLSCITKWVKRSLEPQNGACQESWRCPACNTQNIEVPGQYTCWCTKQVQPEISKTEPHSCGQTCGKPRGLSCPHPCALPCHPGPCAPCMNMGPLQMCFCGKHSSQRKCAETDYAAGGWQCREICGEILPCDEHTCERICHPGLCGACPVLTEMSCYCGKESKPVACACKGDTVTGVDDKGSAITGSWKCASECARFFDCQIHRCSRPCHVKEKSQPSRCPRAPELITTCHCGKEKVENLMSTLRTTCSDPVPSCQQACSRYLPCGHQCLTICHEGPCPQCTHELESSCQCGSTQVLTTCQDTQLGLQPSCEKICRSGLSCGRHICQNKCCSGLPLAQDRLAKRPKGRQAAQLAARHEEIEAEHFCTKSCGKSLSCGNHSCGVMCHPGPCPTCLIASFDDLTCHCGRTAIRAPVACGTSPPACSYECNRHPSCGHPAVSHNCHLDGVSCPRCPYLVERLCMCGKTMVKNQPCWKSNVSCGQICDRALPCGQHNCKKRCHVSADCESPCQQTCGKLRSGCGHPCSEICHEGECPQDADHPCKATVVATCACSNTKMSVRCNSQDPDPEQHVVRHLKCTDFCAITERNKKLSAALGVPGTHKPVQSALYEEDTLDYYRDNKIWCSTIEQAFRAFLNSPDKVKNFKPMKADLRQFVHEMAEAYHMRSISMDEEPHRNVQISKSEQTVAPTKSLGQASLARSALALGGTDQTDKKRGNAYNAFVLVAPRFGLTQDELQESLKDLLTSSMSHLECRVEFSSDAEYAFLKPQVTHMTTEEVEVELAKSRAALRQVVLKDGLADLGEMCWINRAGEMSYRESKKHVKTVGQVKKSGPNLRNAFDALALDQTPEE